MRTRTVPARLNPRERGPSPPGLRERKWTRVSRSSNTGQAAPASEPKEISRNAQVFPLLPPSTRRTVRRAVGQNIAQKYPRLHVGDTDLHGEAPPNPRRSSPPEATRTRWRSQLQDPEPEAPAPPAGPFENGLTPWDARGRTQRLSPQLGAGKEPKAPAPAPRRPGARLPPPAETGLSVATLRPHAAFAPGLPGRPPPGPVAEARETQGPGKPG